MQENETRIGDLEKQLAEIKQTSQNTEYEKEQQITSLKADLEKVQKLLLSMQFQSNIVFSVKKILVKRQWAVLYLCSSNRQKTK